MAKKESTLVNMISALFIISAVAALTLGFVHKITLEPIVQAKEAKLKESLKNVLPEFDNLKNEKIVPEVKPVKSYFKKQAGADTLFVYKAYKDGKYVGVAVKSFTNKGFSGRFDIMVGFDAEGNIFNINVLEHKETPGLGDKMEKAKNNWSYQFNKKNPAEFKIDVRQNGGDVDAITAATISSNAYCDAVKRAYEIVKDIKE